jgi:class 3 adenylate cyclase/tetratricopeptide (TPR) repeat protein
MTCHVCRHDNPPGAEACLACGAALTSSCPSCGARPPVNSSFCNQCGAPLDPSQARRRGGETLFTETSREGERKQVTILFADLKDSMDLLVDTDPEDARRILDPVLEHMIAAVRRYEGTVNQVMGDGIMALFGAPLAQEDHAVRACHAALHMQEMLARYSDTVRLSLGVPLLVRIGLNSGEVVVRTIGSESDMDYSAVGQTTHMAARMEQLASPGSILVTAETLKLAEGYVQAKMVGQLPIKGLRNAVDVYELTGIDMPRSRMKAFAARGLTRFVGRETELELLWRARDEAAAGHGQIVAVMGDPGVGKTRLFYEFTRQSSTEGWLVLATSAVSYGKSTPHLPITDLLRTYFDLDAREDPGRVQEKVAARAVGLDPELEPLLPAFGVILDVPVTDSGWAQLDPSHRRARILEALRRLFVAESGRQPVCLVLENLHWVDLETQAFIDSLVDTIPQHRLLLLVNYRAEYRHPWSAGAPVTDLRIAPLTPPLAAELVQTLVGTDTTLRPLKQLMLDRADGNPLFLEEIVRSLVETEALVGLPGEYRLVRPVRAVQVPETVKALLASRIDRLPFEQERLLQSAAVIGRHVDIGLLREIADVPDDQLRAELAQLQAAGFLYESRRFPDQVYTFRHSLTHDVAYDSLLRTRQRVLHARIVTAIERIYPDQLGEQTERLAEHAFRGEVWDKAVEYLLSAGRRAMFASATREAVAHFERALLALRRLPQTPEALRTAVTLRLNLRDPLWSLGEIERIREELSEADAVARQLDDARALGRVAAYRCHYLWAVGELEAALEVSEQAVAIASAINDGLLLAETKLYRGVVFLAQGDLQVAVDVLSETLRQLDQRSGTRPGTTTRATVLRLLALSFLTRSLAELGRFKEGIACGEEALRLAEPNTAFGLATALAGLGVLYVRKGDTATAIPLLERGLDVSRTYSVTNWIPTIEATLGTAYVLSGRVEDGVALIEHAVDLNRHTGIVATLSLWRAYLGDAYRRAGRLAEAVAEARRALGECRARLEHGIEPWAVYVCAEILAGAEPPDLQEARAHYLEALKLAEPRGMRPVVLRCVTSLARLHERAGEVAAAASYRERAARLAGELEIPLASLDAS